MAAGIIGIFIIVLYSSSTVSINSSYFDAFFEQKKKLPLFEAKYSLARLIRETDRLRAKYPNRKKVKVSLFDVIDNTEELLEFPVDLLEVPAKVDGGNASASGRRRYDDPRNDMLPLHWQPPGYITKEDRTHDAYSIKPRLYALILQLLWQTRDEITVIQDARKELRKDALYRMGFVTAKVDLMVATFFKSCEMHKRQCELFRLWKGDMYWRMSLYEVVQSQERIISKFVELLTLIDIIKVNDYKAKNLLKGFTYYRDLREWWVEEYVEVPQTIEDVKETSTFWNWVG